MSYVNSEANATVRLGNPTTGEVKTNNVTGKDYLVYNCKIITLNGQRVPSHLANHTVTLTDKQKEYFEIGDNFEGVVTSEGERVYVKLLLPSGFATASQLFGAVAGNATLEKTTTSTQVEEPVDATGGDDNLPF